MAALSFSTVSDTLAVPITVRKHTETVRAYYTREDFDAMHGVVDLANMAWFGRYM